MRYSIRRIDEGYTVEDMRSGDRMSYHKSYEAALKSLTKLRGSIVPRDEIVVVIEIKSKAPRHKVKQIINRLAFNLPDVGIPSAATQSGRCRFSKQNRGRCGD